MKLKLRFCKCGCKKLVKKEGALYRRGHHMRRFSKEEHLQIFGLSPTVCALKKAKLKKTLLEKYGVDNVSKLPEVQEKRKKTRIDRYGSYDGSISREYRREISKKAGKLGGQQTAKKWKENPRLFEDFLAKSYKTRLENDTFKKFRGNGNVMRRPEVQKKHKESVIKARNKPGVQFKIRATIERKYGGYTFTPKGDNHYRWQGGKSRKFSRGKDWKIYRNFILDRDEYKCIVCNSTTNLHVHHITPVRTKLNIELLNNPFNLITLCGSCHLSTEWTGKYEQKISDHINNWGKKLLSNLGWE